jgi:hypothetical protein
MAGWYFAGCRFNVCERDNEPTTTGGATTYAHPEATTLQEELLTTTQKALTEKFDGPRYGTLAELGDG